MPLCIKLLRMATYRRDFVETKYISFLIKDNELIEKYNEMWDNVSNIIKRGFDIEPITIKNI